MDQFKFFCIQRNLMHIALFRTSFFLFFILFIPLSYWAKAQNIQGTISDEEGKALAFASIYIKGGSAGTTSNADGKYVLELSPGNYELICAHIGYEKLERKIQLKRSEILVADFTMKIQVVVLNEVVVKAGAEDPAYEIIRKAISLRKEHLEETADIQSLVYMKGLMRTKKIPKRILGRKVNTNDDVFDSTGKGIIYFSESLTRFSKKKNGDYHEEVISAKVSGNSQGFGFNSPQTMDLNFYENNLSISGLNSRGFISPISDNALNFYNYRYEGSFYQDGLEINKIRVSPKRLYEPLFSTGHILIIEGSWRIHSADLYLTKTSQIEIVDTLRVTQEMVATKGQIWVPQYTRFRADFGIFGFEASADFSAVYSEYNMKPLPERFWKNNIIKIIDTSANKKTMAFWDSLRPVPLSMEERDDYVKKDSLEKKFKDPVYLDSMSKIANKFSILGFLLQGQTFSSYKKRSSLFVPSVLRSVSYNTVEQWVVSLQPVYSKRTDTGSYSISPHLRYSTATNRFNFDLIANRRIGVDYKKRINLSFAGGRNVFQINPVSPLLPLNNTIGTLIYGVNYLKVFEKLYGQVAASKNIARGLSLRLSMAYEDRQPLENTDTSYRWNSYKRRSFTSNYPEELPAGFFDKHQAFITTTTLRYQPGVKYIQYPYRLVGTPSDAPVFTLAITNGWKNILGSDVDFGKWALKMRDDLNLKLGGSVTYEIEGGGFFNNNNVQLPDWQHFMGNQIIAAAPYGSSFQLAPYYANSTRDRFYAKGHLEWQLNGLLTNKIPLIRRANIGLVTGTNMFYVDQNRNYYEVFLGVSNILKLFRVDFVWGYNGLEKRWINGIRVGTSGLLTGDGVD